MEGAKLEEHYRETLRDLGQQGGMLGLIFRKAQNKIQDPAKLRQLIVDLIDKEDWLSMSADVKGDAYEGLLERNAQDMKSGAGQYFTPRPLIHAIVDVHPPAARRGHLRPRLRHRRLPALRPRLPSPTTTSSTATRRSISATTLSAASSWWMASAACAP